MPRAGASGENHDRHLEPAGGPAQLCRTIERLAVRGSEEDRRAAETEAEGRGVVRDRLRSVGPAAHRHVRRGRAHDHGAACVPRADRRQDQDAAARLLRRHGRPAQGAGQRAEQGDARGASQHAADQRAGPVLERVSLVRAPQQCAAARVPRPVRLRLRVRERDRLLQGRQVRRDAAQDARAPRQGDGDHAAVAARGARRDLFAVPADLPAHAQGALRADRRARCEERHDLLRRSARRRSASRFPSPAATASCNGSRTGRCAGPRSASTTRCPARI